MLLATGAALATLPPRALAAQQLSAADRATTAATIWSEARYNYAFWDRVRADWDSALAAILSVAGQRQPDVQFYHRLRRLVALLADGRTTVTAAPAVLGRLGRPPVEVRSVEGRPFVVAYDENDELRVARPEPLTEIVSVQGLPAADWVRDSILPETPGASPEDRWRRAIERILEGARGTAVQLVLRLPGGATRGASLTRSVGLNDRWPIETPALQAENLPDHTLWIRVRSFEDPDVVGQFDRALDRFSGATGLIVDLRDNLGEADAAPTGYAILARLTEKPFVTARWRTRLYRPTDGAPGDADSALAWYVAAPDTIVPPPAARRERPAFPGPVAVLTSRRTGGAAEDFVAAFRNAARGTVVGETTAGTSGRTRAVPLRHGWTFRVCVTRNAFPDGVEYGGIGIAPEQPVAVTVADLLAGRDAALDRAREYLAAASGRR